MNPILTCLLSIVLLLTNFDLYSQTKNSRCYSFVDSKSHAYSLVILIDTITKSYSTYESKGLLLSVSNGIYSKTFLESYVDSSKSKKVTLNFQKASKDSSFYIIDMNFNDLNTPGMLNEITLNKSKGDKLSIPLFELKVEGIPLVPKKTFYTYEMLENQNVRLKISKIKFKLFDVEGYSISHQKSNYFSFKILSPNSSYYLYFSKQNNKIIFLNSKKLVININGIKLKLKSCICSKEIQNDHENLRTELQ